MRGGFVAQTMIRCEINALAIYRRQLLHVADRVDAGSNTRKSLIERAAKIGKRIDSKGRGLFRPFDLQAGFGIRGATGAIFRGVCFVLALPLTRTKSVMLDILQKRKDAGHSVVETRRIETEVIPAQATDRYKSWEDSIDKIPIVVAIQNANSSQLGKLGSFEIDANCPLDLTREFLRRSLWRELNEETGAAFDFVQRGDVILESDEPLIKVRDVAPQRLDSTTRELENVLTICNSGSREKKLLEPLRPASSHSGVGGLQ